jgi:myo-inositol-1(or 4)-monophosphatase
MGDDPYRRHREVAERAALDAGVILRAAFGRVDAQEKGPGDLVTEADCDSQRAIATALLGAFPGHTLLAEENGVVPDTSNPWRWVVDPLDGTINFVHGFPLWCVSIALEHEGRLVVGVVHAPLCEMTYSASAGRGASVNGRPLRASTVEHLSASLITTGLPTDFAADADRQMALMRRFSTGTHSLRRTGTTAWNLAQLASGGCEVYYATSVFPWDVAAGVVLVREAGGKVTNLAGGPFDLYCPAILASNGRVHDQAVEAISASWPAVQG